MADIQTQLDNIEKRLDEASAELLAEIAQLKGEQLTEAGKAALDRIESKVNALADVVPGPDSAPPA